MSVFPSRWPVQHPDRIQLYSLATPNGKKASIALEELGVPYEAHRVDIMKNEQFDADYLEVNPNNKIPSIIDPDGPGGEPIRIMESGAILHYLAKKTGRLMPTDPRGENEVLQWVFFQVGSVGPMLGQFGHFHKFAAGKTDTTYGVERYGSEVKRLLGVLDRRLDGRTWLTDDFSIADIAIVPWLEALDFYGGHDLVDYASFENVIAYVERFGARPGVQRGATVCAF